MWRSALLWSCGFFVQAPVGLHGYHQIKIWTRTVAASSRWMQPSGFCVQVPRISLIMHQIQDGPSVEMGITYILAR